LGRGASRGSDLAKVAYLEESKGVAKSGCFSDKARQEAKTTALEIFAVACYFLSAISDRITRQSMPS
jgi:hypothetical protein